MCEPVLTCLSVVKSSNGDTRPCCSKVKGVTYPLCDKHYKRRFIPDQLVCKQIDTSSFCHEIIKTGKNSGKFCSRTSFQNNICWHHLQNYLGKCYFPNCNETSFYRSGLCSYHTIEQSQSSCPCGKHSQQLLENKKYNYCHYHQNIDCDCLNNWINSNLKVNIDLPNDILVLIFDYGDCYSYSMINCLSKYFRDYQFTQQLVSKYCLTSNLAEFDSPFKIEYECSFYYNQLFYLLIDTYNLRKNEVIDLRIFPEDRKLKFYTRHLQNNDINLVHVFKAHYCIIMNKNKDNFIDLLKKLYNVYLSNLSQIIDHQIEILLEFLKNISHQFSFFIKVNFPSTHSFQLYNNFHQYLIRLLNNNWGYS